LGIRSAGAWQTYKYEAHRFADFFVSTGANNLLETKLLANAMADYLYQKLHYHKNKQHSLQTMETTLAALAKMEYALNTYIARHSLDVTPLNTIDLRAEIAAQSRKILRKSSRNFGSRAFPDPVRLIQNIEGEVYQLMACMQYEGGLRCEGAGAPSGRLKNPLQRENLQGIIPDPVSGNPVGAITVKEKGGKSTMHYVSAATYHRISDYLTRHTTLAADYRKYLTAINFAAKKTNQFEKGRGSHGLKHSFALERYHECINYGYNHEQALQQVSLELAHFRLRETLSYTR
jgi:hypothetical protein